MSNIYKNILAAIDKRSTLLSVLIDPDKIEMSDVECIICKINASAVTHIFVGGSSVEDNRTDAVVTEIKKYTQLPLIIFPGDHNQITDAADALLFLSLISGRNPKYLIDEQVKAVSKLRISQLEVIPTGYILVGSDQDKISAVEYVTETKPINTVDLQTIADTAKAGELLGMKLIYLEAGSGSAHAIPVEIIAKVKQILKVPLIVGGGIKSATQINTAFNAGADMVVVGTAFENDKSFFDNYSVKPRSDSVLLTNTNEV